MKDRRLLDRARKARHDLGSTRVSRTTAWVLCIAFLLLCVAVPLGALPAAWLEAAGGRAPAVLGRDDLADAGSYKPLGLPAAEDLRLFEEQVEAESWTRRLVVPRIQRLLARFARHGGEEVVIGRERVLYYRPDLDHVTGPPFLLRENNPVEGLRVFRDALRARGMDLLVMPTPSKVEVGGRFLGPPGTPAAVRRNVAMADFYARLQALGIAFHDPVESITLAAGGPEDVFLDTDSHWSPEGIDAAAAGLPQQLAYHLGASVDFIARNGGGSLGLRQALAGAMARDGAARFSHKRLVIFQFSTRTLSFGDWAEIRLPEPVTRKSEVAREVAAETSRILARVAAITRPPRPNEAAYEDAVIALHLVDVQSDGASMPQELVALGMGMRGRRWTRLAEPRVGDVVDLLVISWEEVSDRYEGLQRVELDDPDFRLIDLPLFWVEEIYE